MTTAAAAVCSVLPLLSLHTGQEGASHCALHHAAKMRTLTCYKDADLWHVVMLQQNGAEDCLDVWPGAHHLQQDSISLGSTTETSYWELVTSSMTQIASS